jgi:hypothetical protein
MSRVLERSLKDSEKLSSGGIVPRACCGNRPGRDLNQEKLWSGRNPQRGESTDRISQKEIAKSH